MHLLTPDDIHFCKWLGEARYKDKQNYASFRPLSDGFAMVGVAGELCFSLKTGYPVDTEIKDGDGGVDFTTPLGTIDIKTLRHASKSGLLVEEGKVRAFIYVLAEFFDEPPAVKFLGYAEACTVRNHPPAGTNKYDIINHRVPLTALEPMEKLFQWLKDIDPGPGKSILDMTNQEFHRRCWAIQARSWWGSLTPPPPKTLQEVWREAGLLDGSSPEPMLGSKKPL